MLQYILSDKILNTTFFQKFFLGNKVIDYIDFVLIFLVFVALIKLFRITVLVLLNKLAIKIQSKIFNFILTKIKKLLVPLEYYGVFYFSVKTLNLHKYVLNTLDVLALLIIVFYVTRFVVSLVDFIIEQKIEQSTTPSKVQVLRAIIPAINILIWVIGIIFILSNLGFNISALVAGLGVGGLAVALAGQKILGDIFSYISILVDKPFEIGDMILVDNHWGNVEYIGIRSTRLKSLTGEMLVFANSDITTARIKNFTKMQERRAEITLGVVYETPLEKLQLIPKIIEEIINSTEKVRFDRSHFHSYGNFSLNFQTIYWIEDIDFKLYMDKQQEILLKIFDAFKKNNIQFAYPTSKVFLENIEKNNSI